MEEAQIAATFILGVIIWETIKLSVARYYKRTVETEYVTVERCRMCREECSRGRSSGATEMQSNIRELGKSLDLLRGILLVLAVKVGVDEETMQKLVRRRDD